VLKQLRQQIDQIDGQLLKLLSQRALIALQIAQEKQQHTLAVHDPEREVRVIQRLNEVNEGALPAEAVARIYRAIMAEMLALEHQHPRAA